MNQPSQPSGQIMKPGQPAVPAPYHPSSEMWLDVGQEGVGFSPMKFLHSFRRTWLPGILAGLVVASTVTGLLWFLVPESYEVIGLIRVSSADRGAFDRGTNVVNEQAFNIFKQTHAELVKSPFVLGRALRAEDIRQSPVLQRREAPETFLEREMSVSYPGRAEILRIALWGKDREETKKIVDAVINAYLQEAQQMERDNVVKRLDTLITQKEKNTTRILDVSKAIKTLADQVGAEDSEKVKAQQMVEFSKFQSLSNQEAKLRQDLSGLQAEYMIVNNARSRQVFSPSQYMIMDELERDPIYGGYKQEISRMESEIASMQGTAVRGNVMEVRAQAMIQAAEEKMKQREAELRPRIIARIKQMYGIDETMQMTQLRDLEVQLKMTEAILKETQKEVADQQLKMQEIFGSSAEMASKQIELKELEESNAEISKQVTALDLDLKAPPRIALLQPAHIPPDSNAWIRWLGIISAALASFVATVLGFTFKDYAKNIMSSPNELERETNLPVLGKLPTVHDGVRSILGGPRRKKGALLSDCVDSVRASLTRGDKSNDIDSVIVTSALGKEGKTTVASQLAVSLARSGKKTVLVDGDVRNPRQHQIFGMAADRGLCDVLRGDATLEDVVQATPSENLWILPAGATASASFQSLSGNDVGGVLTQLRAQFDFVVVDTAPILTGPDAVIFGVHVSGAVIATRQDHSSIEKIDEAQRRLRSVGIRVLGAVINGAFAESRGNVLSLPAA